MSDEADIANDRIETEMQLRMRARQTVQAVSEDCVECGVIIPEARQQALGGTELCVDCAGKLGR